MKEVYIVMEKCYYKTFPLCVEATKEKAKKSIRALEERRTPTKDYHYYIEKVLSWV